MDATLVYVGPYTGRSGRGKGIYLVEWRRNQCSFFGSAAAQNGRGSAF